MTNRVHPNSSLLESPTPNLSNSGDPRPPPPPYTAPIALTVWRKSLLFNCNGFTVFDSNGNLIFRVDKYAKSGNRGEIVLMDASGSPLLTIRRKILSLGGHWQIYDGEEATNPLFSVRKHVNFIQSKSLAHLTACNPPPATKSGYSTGEEFEVKGSYARRCCEVYDERSQVVAEIRRKEEAGGVAFGTDVFRLVVKPGFDASVAMAIVILLEEMLGSKKSIFKF